MRTMDLAKLLCTTVTLAALTMTIPAFAADVITFDSLPTLPPTTGDSPFFNANGDSLTFDGIDFSSNVSILGDGYYGIVTPISGHYGILNDNGAPITLTTSKTLESVYIGQTGGAYNDYASSSITINALNGNTVLGFVTATPASSTMSFVDTSSFASLTGITGYSFVPAIVAGHPFFAGDDFTFASPAAVPEPGTWSVLALFASGIAGLAWKRSKARA